MQEEIRTFQPQDFLQQYYSTTQGNKQDQMENAQQIWACEAFQIIPDSQSCLELGCGPILNLAACASRKCKNIYLTQYNIDCFKHIVSELTKDTTIQKSFWTDRFKIIANIEGTNQKDVQTRLKQRVAACFPCDISRDKILIGIQYLKKVDVIISSLTVQVVAKDQQDYIRILKNIKKLLKPQGYIYLFGVLQQTFYTVKNKKLPVYPLNEEKIKNAFQQNGLEIIKLNIKKKQNSTKINVDCQGFFSILGKLKS